LRIFAGPPGGELGEDRSTAKVGRCDVLDERVGDQGADIRALEQIFWAIIVSQPIAPDDFPTFKEVPNSGALARGQVTLRDRDAAASKIVDDRRTAGIQGRARRAPPSEKAAQDMPASSPA
jgi:hypothetical protein